MNVIMKGCFGALCAGGIALSAEATTITFSDFSLGETQSVGINYSGVRGDDVNLSAQTGQLKYTVGAVGAEASQYFSPGDMIITFCVDIWDNASSGTANFGELTDTPMSPDSGITMESYRAELISVLWSQFYNGAAGNDSLEAAAFQIAIWEIAHEDNFDGTSLADLDVTAGAFFASSNMAAQNRATTMLADAFNAWAGGAVGTSLGAAFADGFQDIILVIPLPAPVWMAGIGLLGVITFRRRLMPS